MTQDTPPARGRIGREDRIQRLVIGLALMTLTVFGLARDPSWEKWIALAIQLELITTGLVGWCPFYWSLAARHTHR